VKRRTNPPIVGNAEHISARESAMRNMKREHICDKLAMFEEDRGPVIYARSIP
jgi:hypothetical protein